MLQNGHILPGKVRETVYVKDMLRPVIAVLQPLQKPGHLVSGVSLALGAQAVIGLHHGGKLFQLLGKAAGGRLGCLLQILRGDAAALELVHRIHQLFQKLRLALHRGIGFQPAGQLPGTGRHGHHPAAAVQAGLARAAHALRHTAAQPGKGQHLRKAAGPVPGIGAEGPLHFVADELRHQQHPALQLLVHIRFQLLQYGFPQDLPVRTQQQPQHFSYSFL